MTIEIELDGRRCQVTLRREGDNWLAGLDGREVAVSVVEADGSPGGSKRWSMLVTGLPPEGGSHDLTGGHNLPDVASAFRRKSYDIAIEARAGGELLVHVNGVVVPVLIDQSVLPKRWAKAGRRRRRGGVDTDGGTQPQTIVAPMPGRIVRVLVQPGEQVQARQGLVVVEAMKMENELRAPRSGTVAEIRVTEGSSVEANAVLVVLR